LRWSEIAGRRFGHIDFLNRRLQLVDTTAEVDGQLLEHQETKSKAGTGTLAVPPLLTEILGAHITLGGRPAPDELVFVLVTPVGRPLRASNFRTKVLPIASTLSASSERIRWASRMGAKGDRLGDRASS